MKLPIESMTIAEKLDAMEQLWNSLQNDPVSETSPTWHAEVLEERRKQFESGETKFFTIDEVRERLRRQVL